MMQVFSMRWAIRGISSEISIPGTEVAIERNGPPVDVPGLGSHVSSWLEPPANHSRITRLFFRFSSLASAGCFKTSRSVMSAANAAAPAATVPRKPRRFKA